MRPRPRRPLLTGALFFAAAVAALHASGCLGTGSCDSLRKELLDDRTTWSACDPSQGDEQCALVAGDGTDCTGVFKCDFPVQRAYLAAAEQGVVDVASKSPECTAICSGITCPPDSPPRCDPYTRRCVMDVLNEDAGGAPPDESDTGAPPIVVTDAGLEDT